MAKYILQLKQSIGFDEEQTCFEALVQAMDEAQKEGFLIVKIMRNHYYLRNPNTNQERAITVLKGIAK